ncbi:phytanoyl-CoA dioxygenase family protein [Acuticoccus mangrovi]|uniref:Phytanoyl-CoA dioxygenase family protein n=1 Tax=Acuticoccus mangrovi TaxID=2796142 RepID=A0A934MJT4_9HYPH|nr:phytanoyl-CoA dioxygenase family protein [Acuticoccus mangrovi]MBJ3778646.1 phytanoyl-CoA dioxygenase family protein [Acuticoccus mangrovi]
MKLTQDQIDEFNREGFLFIPEAFSPEEVDALREASDEIFAEKREEIWYEKSGVPRTAFACQRYNEAFRLLGRHPRLIEPVEQLFGEKLYMHQFKVNAKAAFAGDVWQWHQDYVTWQNDDGMPEPRAMNISVFLDEVMPINGPLMLIRRSHTHGAIKAGHDTSTTAYPLWTLDNDTVAKLVAEGGIAAPTGKPGGLLIHHGNLVHGSAGNITPYPRKIVYLTLNAVSNAIRTPTRKEWIAHQDFAPIEPVDDDALVRYARSRHREAAE